MPRWSAHSLAVYTARKIDSVPPEDNDPADAPNRDFASSMTSDSILRSVS